MVPSTSEEEKLLDFETTYTNNVSSRLKTAVIKQDMIQTLPCVEKVLGLLQSYVTPSKRPAPPGTLLMGGFWLSHADCHHMMCWGLQLFLKSGQS